MSSKHSGEVSRKTPLTPKSTSTLISETNTQGSTSLSQSSGAPCQNIDHNELRCPNQQQQREEEQQAEEDEDEQILDTIGELTLSNANLEEKVLGLEVGEVMSQNRIEDLEKGERVWGNRVEELEEG